MTANRDNNSKTNAVATDAPNPYSRSPDYAFWRRAVSRVPWNFLDPMVSDHPIIDVSTRVASSGSCFAQNVAKFIQAVGYNYHIVEPAPDGVSLFSARYGNIYTVRQQLQLFRQAYGEIAAPTERHVWKRQDDNLFVDALRPQTATPFPSPAEAIEDRVKHLACVKTVFQTAEVFIFTLGLTECWAHRADGMIYPVAPGVLNREFDPADYVFMNMAVAEVIADLDAFFSRLREVNPRIKLILTVSPVPLIATHENQHVLVANSYSKSVLRTAAHEVCRKHKDAFYFPAYEIFTGLHTGGRLYERDRRTVTAAGVDLAMRFFMKHFSVRGDMAEHAPYIAQHDYSDVVCEPELLSAGLAPQQ